MKLIFLDGVNQIDMVGLSMEPISGMNCTLILSSTFFSSTIIYMFAPLKL